MSEVKTHSQIQLVHKSWSYSSTAGLQYQTRHLQDICYCQLPLGHQLQIPAVETDSFSWDCAKAIMVNAFTDALVAYA